MSNIYRNLVAGVASILLSAVMVGTTIAPSDAIAASPIHPVSVYA